MKYKTMQKVNKFMCLTFTAGILLTTSCKKTGEVPEKQNEVQETSHKIQVVNGRLVFNDTASFGSTIRYLTSKGNKVLKQWDNDNGITSMEETYRSVNEQIAARDSSKQLYKPTSNELSVSERAENGTILWIPDRAFASVLNSKGECQIGAKIYRVTQHKVYAVRATDEILLQKDDLTNAAVEVTAVKDLPLAPQQTGAAYRTGHFTGEYTVSTEVDVNRKTLPQTWDKRPTRLTGTQWNKNWGVYASHGVRSQYEYKSKYWGWLDNDCAEIYVKGMSAIRELPNITIFYPIKQDLRYDDDVVESTLDYTINLYIEIVWSNSTHRAIYKGATAQISM